MKCLSWIVTPPNSLQKSPDYFWVELSEFVHGSKLPCNKIKHWKNMCGGNITQKVKLNGLMMDMVRGGGMLVIGDSISAPIPHKEGSFMICTACNYRGWNSCMVLLGDTAAGLNLVMLQMSIACKVLILS